MKLFLVDGYSLLYRAFFSSPPLTTREGQPTGALYGFTRMLLRLLDEAKPEYAVVALDASGPTFRHDSYTDYKANRQAAPDDLKTQSRLARDLLDGLSIPRYEHQGFEGDDVLGTMARTGAEKGLDVTVVTGDGDALQLVNEQVSVMLTRRGVSDLECFTPEAVQARYGFVPALLPDFKGLRGDSSDNIPGVPGIGDKTGMSLIGRFGALENLYQHLDEVTPPRIRGLLEEHREVAFQSRELARIVTDLPVELDFEAWSYGPLDEAARETALSTVRLFEFKSMIARYSGTAGTTAEAAASGEGGGEFAPGESVSTETGDMPPAMTYPTSIARSATEVEQWLQQHAPSGKPVALLLPAFVTPSAAALTVTSANAENLNAGCALGCDGQALFYTGDITALRPWLEDEQRPKIVHDAKTLKLVLCRCGIALRGVVADSLLMGYLLDPTRQNHPLPQLVEKYLSRALPSLEPPAAPPPAKKPAKSKAKAKTSLFDEDEAAGDETANEAQPEAASPDETPPVTTAADAAAPTEPGPQQSALAVAAAALCELEPALRGALRGIGEETIFDELELPLVDVLVAMEQCGMLLDVAQLRELEARLEADAARLQSEIWELAGEEFNIGSTKQLQVLLFEKLGLAKGRATKTGYSTDVHTLEKLAEEHEVVRKILEYRGTTKLKSTYVDALLKGMDAETYRIHTNLNQTGTVSGRLSSSEPNLQNVPIRTEQGRLIRKAFIAPPGHVILAVDYSQIELRILAHITGDEPLVEAFRAGQDVHSRTAADLFDVAIDAVDSDMRRKAKMTNYAIAYGVSGFGLAKQLGTGSAAEAQEFIKRYFEALPGVKNYIDDILKTARAQGFVQTLMGRRRPLPEISSPRAPERAGAERTAINHPIQGTSADAMKLAMLAIHDDLRREKFKARMTMQVHDELVFEVPDDEIKTVAALVARRMRQVPTQALELRVPLEVEVEAGPNWNDTEPVEGWATD